MSNNPSSRLPWSVPLAVRDVTAEGYSRHLVADTPTCAAIARLAQVAEIVRLEADIAAVPQGPDGLRVTGRVSATVGQICGVTLEPMQSEVDEAIDLLYLRDPVEAARRGENAEEEPGKVGDERIEVLKDETIDLGGIVFEFLILGIDPYPRKPEAVFAPPPLADDPSSNPFSALAALKKVSGNGDG